MDHSDIKATFDRDGYVILRQLLDDAILDRVRDVVADKVDAFISSAHAEGKIPSLYTGETFERRWAMACKAFGAQLGKEGRIVTSWGGADIIHETIYDLYTDSRLIGAVAALLGPELRANGDFWVRPKISGDATTTLPWHQDRFYYASHYGNTTGILAAWIPLVDVNDENGCVRLVPGSNTFGLIPSRELENGLREPVEDVRCYGNPVSAEMAVGDVLLFGSSTLHASGTNTMDNHVRWNIDMRYVSVGKDFDVEAENERIKLYPCFQASSTDSSRITPWPVWRDCWTKVRAEIA